jgi:hypothetical protein
MQIAIEAKQYIRQMQLAINELGRLIEGPELVVLLPSGADSPEKMIDPSCSQSIIPTWDAKQKTLVYNGKTKQLRADADARAKVFDWFQETGWKDTKIQGLDPVENSVEIGNLVRRANQMARCVGIKISRSGDTLTWTVKQNT